MGDRGTRRGWRLAAGLALGGGLAIGRWLSLETGALPVAVALAALTVLPVFPIVIAGRARRPGYGTGLAQPTVSVVVAARDEARVIGRLVTDLAAQDHLATDGRPDFELIVIDDRSVDGTAATAVAAAQAAGFDGLRVVRRAGSDLPDGKGAALAAVPPTACRGDVVVVLDADARVGPAFLSTLAAHVARGAVAIAPRRRTAGASGSLLAAAQAVEQVEDGVLQSGRHALGGCSEFRGNGITIRRDVLEAVGGWRAGALTEDLDLSSRMAAATGETVLWLIDAPVDEDPVRGLRALVRQRVRWSEGSIRRLLEHGPAVMTSRRLSLGARLDFALYGVQPVAVPVVCGAAGGIAFGGSAAPLLLLVAGYVTAAGILAWVGVGREAAHDSRSIEPLRRAALSLTGAIFSAIWLVAVPWALWRLATRRGAVRYEKMEHGEALAVGPPAG